MGPIDNKPKIIKVPNTKIISFVLDFKFFEFFCLIEGLFLRLVDILCYNIVAEKKARINVEVFLEVY